MVEKVLVPGIYDPKTSLSRSFWSLARDIDVCEGDILTRRLADIVVKYFYAIFSGDSIHKAVSEKRINQAFQVARVGDGIESGRVSPERGDEILKTNPYKNNQIGDISYQLRMLGDVASTIALVGHIINTTLENSNSHDFYGLDIGSGTGIMLLALYLQSLKQGKLVKTNCGIEINPAAAEKAHHIISHLGIGDVVRGNICNSKTLLSSCSQVPTMIINENIPGWGEGATTSNSRGEPFFMAINALGNAYGFHNLKFTNHFPHSVGLQYWRNGKYVHRKSGSVWQAIGGEKTYGRYRFPETDFLHGENSYDFQKGAFITIQPSKNTSFYSTCSVGNEHIGKIVEPYCYTRSRWWGGHDL